MAGRTLPDYYLFSVCRSVCGSIFGTTGSTPSFVITRFNISILRSKLMAIFTAVLVSYTPIITLFLGCRPFTIIRFIVSIVIDSI